VTFVVVDPASTEAQWALRSYTQELETRFEERFDVEGTVARAATDYAPPHGLFVLALDGSEVMACGALAWLDDERAEVKRMWVAPSYRGRGLATRLLEHLEGLVASSGRDVVVLDTNDGLTEAIALYDKQGYERVERYNDNPHARLWFRKQLG
jgi:ribosomal protein S18 acetylase RimI-like enzyme